MVSSTDDEVLSMDPSDLMGILRDLGINLSASIIFEFLKTKFGAQQPVEKAVFEQEFSAFLKMHGVPSVCCN